ncbi:uncharacterized protein LOC105697241 isoform X2 [Orussus abietinus]|uniref:uncharacterized protein LOC105697241 isoform X2 n=1 Tax=Orussus abietinus TaxID=222816 RepID=UPI00062648E5|nr:uncharacterized protein LOC105697241 isoform X2 [Orussus abietinus]
MLIYDVLHREKVHQIITSDLKNFGVKFRLKKNVIKTEKAGRNPSVLKKVFKTQLSYLPLDVVSLSSGAIIHIPIFVSQATSYLEKHLNQEGLFRKAGSQVRQKELINRLDNGGTLGEKHHAIDVASALKTFFRDLPEPLIPYHYHDLFVRCATLKARCVEALLLACLLLPPHHLNTLAFFMEFLKKVSMHEKLNKMNIDNLAKVIGPNVMPLQETTMTAVQARLEAHLFVTKILIANAEEIGVLPEHIAEALSVEITGSIENDLDSSDPFLRSKIKKKKHRSGSLTRMLNGLKKIVGKNSSPTNSGPTCTGIPSADLCSVDGSSTKIGKKRKVMETDNQLTTKKKRDLIDAVPDNTSIHLQQLGSPVSTRARRINDKLDKSKKIRLSLDRFVTKNKQKIDEADIDVCKQTFTPCMERRWSLANTSSGSKKKRRTQSVGHLHIPSLKRDLTPVQKNYDQLFMEADVNLSDDSNEQVSQEKVELQTNRAKRLRISTSRKSLDTVFIETPGPEYSTQSLSEQKQSKIFFDDCMDNQLKNVSETCNDENEDYVKVSRSEYEEIKNRVSAIESCISQEFASISNDTNNSVSKVQSQYEKTLEEAGIDSITTADHLARRLGKELKIRRSGEKKIIRSPSARKIGNLRRRSQEKPGSKRISRTASWHSSHQSDLQHIVQDNLILNNFYTKCNLDREQIIDQTGSMQMNSLLKKEPQTFCSDETNSRLDYLQQQLHTLITHTAEHTRYSLSNNEISTMNDEVFEVDEKELHCSTKRRASSFHGNEIIDNSQYFNQKVKELKKTNSQQNMLVYKDLTSEVNKSPKTDNEIITWRQADKYFVTNRQNCTPLPQTGRASVAKLRTQNAGMVLAKAKLFDDNSTKRSNTSHEFTVKNVDQKDANVRHTAKAGRIKEVKSVDLDTSLSNIRKGIGPRRKHSRTPKSNSVKLKLAQSPETSPLIKMELTILPSRNQQTTEKYLCKRNSQKLDQTPELSKSKQRITEKENRTMTPPGIIKKMSVNTLLQESGVHIFDTPDNALCRTPHIKRPLSVKTPKSSKSLVRRPPIDTRRTPLKATAPLSVNKRPSPKSVLKSRHLSRQLV